TSEGRLHESCGLGLLGRVESGGCDVISHGRIPAGNNIRGNDVEQVAGNTSVGEVGGDACAHGSGSEDSNFIDALHNLVTLNSHYGLRVCSSPHVRSTGQRGSPPVCPVLQLQNPGGEEPMSAGADKACTGWELRKVDARRQAAPVAQAGAYGLLLWRGG